MKRLLDLRPGAIPEIHEEGDRITYLLEIAGAHGGRRLIIQCDANGEIWASIDRRPSSHRNDRSE